jgi:hypothetical protein
MGAVLCTECPTGRFFNETAASVCEPCAIGSLQPLQGQIECPLCPTGQHQPATAQVICAPCLEGKFASRVGTVQCDACLPGTFQDLQYGTICSECPAGRAESDSNSVECSICAPGTFTSNSSAIECTSCPAGSYQSVSGRTSCQLCPVGTFSSIAAFDCQPCAPRTANPFEGAASCLGCALNAVSNDKRTTCFCEEGFYSLTPEPGSAGANAGILCLKCPDGSVCDSVGVSFETLTTKDGWWRQDNSSLEFYRCILPEHCEGGRESECGANREGPVCANCKDGFTSSTGISPCEPCPSQGESIGMTIFFLLLIVLVLLCMYAIVLRGDAALMLAVKREDEQSIRWDEEFDDEQDAAAGLLNAHKAKQLLRKHPSFTFKLKIIVGWLQILTNLAFVLDVPWPRLYQTFIQLFDVVNFEFINFQSISCVQRIDFYFKFVLVTTVPIVLSLFIVLVFFVPRHVLYKCRLARQTTAEDKQSVKLAQKRTL